MWGLLQVVMFRMRAPWRGLLRQHRTTEVSLGVQGDISVQACGSTSGGKRPDLYQDFTFVSANPLWIRRPATRVEESGLRARSGQHPRSIHEETPMSKRARKRRSRKGNAANHGRKPNA
jgi:hypothetical protein